MPPHTIRRAHRTPGRLAPLMLVIACCMFLTACGLPGSDSTSPTPERTSTSVPTPIPTTAVTSPLSIAPPVWTTGINPSDGSPIDQVEWFPTDATVIYAAFQTSEIASGTGFTVSWSMNGTAVPGLNPTLQMNTDTPAGWIEFHLTRTSPEPWPEGQLDIHLSIGGTIVSSGSIELRDT